MIRALVAALLLALAAPAYAQVFQEDSAHVSGHFGSFSLCVRKDTATALAGTDGDYIPCIVDSSGRLWMNAVQSGAWTVAATQSGGWTVTANAGTNLNTSALALESGGNLAAIAASLAGTLTVGTHAVTQSGTWTVQPGNTANTTPWLASIAEGGVTADVLDLTNANPLTVAILDGAGSQITSFGGGTQYTEADTDASITGTAMLWEDAADTLRAVSSAKPLPVNVVAGGAGDGAIQDGASPSIEATVLDFTNSNPLAVRLSDTNGDYVAAGAGTQYTEDAAAAADPVGGTLIMVRDDALSGQTTTDGDNVAARGTDKGELYVKHVDAIPVTDNAGSLTVDGTVAVSSLPALVAGTANIGDVDVLTVPAPLSTTGGGTEAAALRVTIATDSTGVLSVDDNGASLTVDGTVAISSLPASTNTLEVVGDAAHDATLAGNPVLMAGASSAAAPADVSADGEAVRAWHLRNGAAATVLTAAGALIGGDATNGLDVDVTRLPALVAGTANIGDVDVLTVPAPLSTTGGGTEATALRVTLANDSTGVVSVDDNGGSLTVDGTVTIGTFPDNEPVNVAQMNGVAVTMGNGASGTGVQRVTLADDSTGEVRIADDAGNQLASATAAPTASARGLVVRQVGPCLNEAKSFAAVNISTATTTLIITGVGGQHAYICSIALVTAAANNVAFIAGTGATCGTSTAGMAGGTTAASGFNLAANGGFTLGSGSGTVMSTNVSGGATGDSVCIVTSAATQLSGVIGYVLE